MQVYELITALSQLPAGAEVEFRTLMTLKEFALLDTENCDGDKDLYSVCCEIQETQLVNDKLVALYA